MGSDGQAEVVFPVSADGRRSTTAVGRAVVADALRQVDPGGAAAAEQEPDWRTGYLRHFRRLIEAGLPTGDAALTVARNGLNSLHQRLRVERAGGAETPLDDLLRAPAPRCPAMIMVAGSGKPETELVLPYRGEELRGGDLMRHLDGWAARGIIEPSCAEAVAAVAANPDWLGLPGRSAAVLGAGAEVGPLPVLLNWGVRVIAIDLPRPAIWTRLLNLAHGSGGTLVVPIFPRDQLAAGEEAIARHAGLDLVSEVPAAADWLAAMDGPLVLGNYTYADGGANVLVSAAADALTMRLRAARDDVALAFLATPTDVFAVPAEAVAQSARAYATRPAASRLAGGALGMLSGGRLLQRAYQPGADPGVSDSLVAQQGPNYALAKRLQRWRAALARDAGQTVSMNVAPPTRTRSVLKNRGLAAAYAGAHRFGVEIFEPATCRVLMAALLVHDLYAGPAPGHAAPPGHAAHPEHPEHPEYPEHPWRDEARAAAHGGLWRMAYAPRSALSLAALLGYRAARAEPGR